MIQQQFVSAAIRRIPKIGKDWKVWLTNGDRTHRPGALFKQHQVTEPWAVSSLKRPFTKRRPDISCRPKSFFCAVVEVVPE